MSFVVQGAHGRPDYTDAMFNSGATDPQDLRSAQRRLKQAAQRTGLGGQVSPIASALSRRTWRHATIAAALGAIGEPVVELS